MSEENRTPTRQLVEIGEAHLSVESANDAEDNLQSQLLERKLLSSEFDRKINALVASLATQIGTLIRWVRRELSEKSSNRSTEGNVESERSRSSAQRSDM